MSGHPPNDEWPDGGADLEAALSRLRPRGVSRPADRVVAKRRGAAAAVVAAAVALGALFAVTLRTGATPEAGGPAVADAPPEGPPTLADFRLAGSPAEVDRLLNYRPAARRPVTRSELLRETNR